MGILQHTFHSIHMTFKLYPILLITLVISSTAITNSKPDIGSTKALLKAMNKTYKGKWFDQFTFIQETIKFDKQGKEKSKAIWYEAVDYPKKFRIDYGDISNGNTTIYDKDSAWVFRDHHLKEITHSPREFLLMKGGLYHQSVKETLNQLHQYGYDCSKFRIDELNGKKVYVIGADEGDLKSRQFWMDAEHFYMVRRIHAPKEDIIVDVIYSDHIATNGGWVEQTVEFWVNNSYYQIEYYKDINTNPKLNANIFDPEQFGKIKHWTQY